MLDELRVFFSDGDLLKHIVLVISLFSGAIGLWKLVFLPLWNWWKKYRVKNPSFRKSVLLSLQRLELGLKKNDDYTAALIRERLESAYTIYVLTLGWCPSGEKRMLMDLFALYEEGGHNHLDLQYKNKILVLPEVEPKKEAS